MNNQRPAIPLPIKREVRQRCGFGCVICGLPLYEYEHMEEWAIVHRHVADEITILCNQHHTEKTKGLLPKEIVRKANQNPFNLQKGRSKPYQFHFYGDRAEMKIGSNIFISERDEHGPGIGIIPIIIDSFHIIGFRIIDEVLLLDLELYSFKGNKIVEIKENELIYDANLWDVEFVGTILTVRQKLGRKILEIEFKPPHTVIVKRAQIYFNGVHVEVSKDSIRVMNNNIKWTNCSVKNVPYPVVIGDITNLQYIGKKDIVWHVEGFPRIYYPFYIK